MFDIFNFKQMNKNTDNFLKHITEEENPILCNFFAFCGKVFRVIRFTIIAAALIGGLIYLSHYEQSHSLPPIIDTAEAHDTQPTHYLMEYYAPDDNGITKRYVRTVNIAMFDLVAGTARDHGINPAHLQAICIQEGVEFVGEHAFACSPTAEKPDEGAIGAFQIRWKYHGEAKADAQHPYYSAVWTADRLLRYGYSENPYRAMGRHNGGGAAARKYAGKVWQIAKTMRIIKEMTL